MKPIAIIPARSGSKRIRDKNIVPLAGKPLMAWAIENAVQSGVFERVFVSTDSERYAEIARRYGAWVPFLREHGADDHTSVMQMLTGELGRVERALARPLGVFAVMQATCPLLRAPTIAAIASSFANQTCKTMASCFPFTYANPWWAFKLEGHEAAFVLSEPGKSRSQDRPPLYCPSGAIGFARAETFREEPTFYGPGHAFHPISWREGIDIDTPEDLEMCEILMQRSLHAE